MRTVISIWLLSSAILIGGAILAAFTPGAALDAAISIDTYELTVAAGSLPLQHIDHPI